MNRSQKKDSSCSDLQPIEEWLRRKIPNHPWFKIGPLTVYLRNSQRYIQSSRVETLELSNVWVRQDRRGRGIFTYFLEQLELIADKNNKVVFVENVLVERFCTFFLRRGYKLIEGTNPPCYYRRLS